jgi:hypothetical protein
MSPLTTLRAPRPPVPWEAPPRAPQDAATDRVWIGADPHGLGFEVAVAAWSATGPPTAEALRALHAGRLRARAVPLCVAVYDAAGRAWILGPVAATPVLGPLPDGQAARLLQAALLEPTATAARARILQARETLETAEIPGLDSQGLFAIRELAWGVPRRPDWPAACERSRVLMATSPRGAELISGLGFDAHTIPGNALLLTVGEEPPLAVAILLNDNESFDAESTRFGKSSIYHGLEIARRHNVRWLVIARGQQLRLYPTAPDVGVGRRGATQTYFGLDLALLPAEHAGYLDLAFGARALAPGGSADEILTASRDYAVSLGERLRDRVYEAVVPSLSTAIASALAAAGPLDEARLALAHRLTLRILFRLLFQAYAEDTRLLPLHRNERYTRASLKELARDLAAHPEAPHDPRSTSVWDGLTRVWRVIDNGDEAWGVPAYDGGLFGAEPDLHPDGVAIARLVLHNDAVGPALAGLLVDVGVDGDRGPVDFRSLDVRDFGTIYEGLLESGLSLATDDLTVDASGAWRPAKAGEKVEAQAGQPYFHTKSGDRKATGSYFTKPFAVEHLLERALDPALDAHLEEVAEILGRGDQVGAARRLFDFRVADLAMGSGHFLVAAIGHIEAKFGAFLERNPIPGVERELLELGDAALAALRRVGVEEPAIDRSALLGRQIARRCIYGIDVNDIAVELARLAIWVRTFVPGLPMSSLDHQLVCGNSLTGIGTIEEAVEALDPGAAAGTLTFSGAAIRAALDRARVVLEDAAALKESTSEETRAAQEASRQALEAAEPARLLFDAAVAVRLGILAPPADFDAEGISIGASSSQVQDALRDLRPAHFPVRFPEVFLREPSGFDVLVGNPPWEKLHVKEDVWWALREPGLLTLPASHRRRRITLLEAARPDLVAQLEAERAFDDKVKQAIASGPFPGIGAAHIDLYVAFAWRNWLLLRSGGSAGVVLPRGALTGSGAGQWRRAVLTTGAFPSVVLGINRRHWIFDGVHEQNPTIAFTIVSRQPSTLVGSAGPFFSLSEFLEGRDRLGLIPVETILANSAVAALPALRDQSDAEVFQVLTQHKRLDSDDGFSFRLVQGDINITTDRALFEPERRAELDLPVLSGGCFNLWNPDHSPPFGWAGDAMRRHLLLKARKGVDASRSAYFGQRVRSDADLAYRRARIAVRQITNSTNTRTCIACLVPPGTVLASGAHYLHQRSGGHADEAYVLGILASIPFDWYIRRWVELNLTFEMLYPSPMPRPHTDSPLRARVAEIAARLAAADARFESWAAAVGVPVGSVGEAEKPDLIAELDAVVAHLYGLTREHVEHVFTTFHRGWDYRDRLDRVLAHYDRWGAAAR